MMIIRGLSRFFHEFPILGRPQRLSVVMLTKKRKEPRKANTKKHCNKESHCISWTMWVQTWQQATAPIAAVNSSNGFDDVKLLVLVCTLGWKLAEITYNNPSSHAVWMLILQEQWTLAGRSWWQSGTVSGRGDRALCCALWTSSLNLRTFRAEKG